MLPYFTSIQENTILARLQGEAQLYTLWSRSEYKIWANTYYKDGDDASFFVQESLTFTHSGGCLSPNPATSDASCVKHTQSKDRDDTSITSSSHLQLQSWLKPPALFFSHSFKILWPWTLLRLLFLNKELVKGNTQCSSIKHNITKYLQRLTGLSKTHIDWSAGPAAEIIDGCLKESWMQLKAFGT